MKKYEEGRRNKAPEEEMEIIHKGLTQGHAQLHSLLDEKEEEIAEAEKVRESLNIIDWNWKIGLRGGKSADGLGCSEANVAQSGEEKWVRNGL